MADNSESDGLDNRVPEFEKNAASKLCGDAEFPTPPSSHDSGDSIAASKSKRVKMDNDDDGAPSSSDASPVHKKEERNRSSGAEGRDSIVSFDTSAESTPRKSSGKPKSSANSTSQASSGGQDLSLVDMKTSWDGSAASGGSAKGEITDGETGYRIPFKHRAGMLADPVKIAKEREKEERVRQARERLKEERRRKLVELKEQQRIAQENREKQLEMRRKKIEDLRRRDVERRAAVEERRKVKEEFERARRESILQKSEERVARFEAWKAGGRKAINGGGDASARLLSMSTSVLYAKRSLEYSSLNALHPPSRPCSAMGLETIREGRRSFIGTTSTPTVSTTAQHHQRPSNVPGMGSSMNRTSMTSSMPSPVKMRENKAPRKQRPASVASSMPSFVGGEPAKSPRSKSTDRTGRDRLKTRPPWRNNKAEKENLSEKSQKLNDMEEDEKEKDADGDGARDSSHRKEKKERVSLSFFDRLSTPKFSKKDPEHVPKETPPKKESPSIRVQFADDKDQDGVVEPESQKFSQLKAHSTTSLDVLRKRSIVGEKPSASHTKEASHKHVLPKASHRAPTSAGRSVSPGRKEAEKSAARVPSPGRKGSDKPSTPVPSVTPPRSATSTPTPGPTASTPTPAVSSASTTPSQPLATSIAEDGTTSRSSGGPAQDITAEEYKARLAEKRRQAREKAEKEAEEDRRRQEEARLAEEEKIRREEEEDRRLEEEAELARKAEQARLEKAIEAEEKRRKEEAEKMEQEKKIKEETDKKAKEEAERLEKEKQDRAKKEEEERLQRKKKLEMIMKRVKTDATSETPLKAESPTKSLNTSVNLSQLDSSQNSPDEHEKPVATAESSDEDSQAPAVTEGSAVETYSADMTTSFMQDFETSVVGDTALSTSTSVADIQGISSTHDEGFDSSAEVEQLVTSTTATSSAREETAPSPEPEAKSKFRSPLLQQLVENKGGNTPSGTPKFKSPLLQNLLGKTKVGARMGLSSSSSDLVGKDSASSADESGSTKESHNHGKDEDKDEDTSAGDSFEIKQEPESFEHFSMTNGIGKDSGDGHFSTSSSKSFDSSPFEATKLPMGDSALGSSIEPHGEGMMSQSIIFNGHGDHKRQGMEDSSISLFSIEESVTSQASVLGTLPESERRDGTPASQTDEQLDELISFIDTSGKINSLVTGRPLIAFEENNRRSDVTEYLS